MKNIILSVALLLIATITTNAQNSLFKSLSLSPTDQYVEFTSVYDEEGDGTYEIKDTRFLVKFTTENLPTGEGYKIEAIVESEDHNKGHLELSYNAALSDVVCNGFPYESVLLNKKENSGIVAVGDYVFVIHNLNNEMTSFKGISKVFIKKGAVPLPVAKEEIVEEVVEKKETKEEIMAAIRNASTDEERMAYATKLAELVKAAMFDNSAEEQMVKHQAAKKAMPSIYGEAHGALQQTDLNKMITDYLVAMKAKQDTRTATQKQKVKNNFEKAKAKSIQDEKDSWEEAKRYNAEKEKTPEYQRLRAHQASMAAGSVTIKNETGRTIYVSEKGDNNFMSREVWDGGSTQVNCDKNYVYFYSDERSDGGVPCYNANAACGKSVTVK